MTVVPIETYTFRLPRWGQSRAKPNPNNTNYISISLSKPKLQSSFVIALTEYSTVFCSASSHDISIKSWMTFGVVTRASRPIRVYLWGETTTKIVTIDFRSFLSAISMQVSHAMLRWCCERSGRTARAANRFTKSMNSSICGRTDALQGASRDRDMNRRTQPLIMEFVRKNSFLYDYLFIFLLYLCIYRHLWFISGENLLSVITTKLN